MASAVTLQQFLANNSVQMWNHDPDTTAATVVTPDAGTTLRYVDLRDFEGFVFGAMTTVLGGSGITKIEIVAADDTAGTNVTVIKDSGTIAADALYDWAILECTAAEIAKLSEDSGYSLRYVAGRITMQNSGDEADVIYIRTDAKRHYLNLTPATTIA